MARSQDIFTDRLRITPFCERHVTGRYIGWLNNKELMRYSEQRHKVHTAKTCQAYLNSFDKSPNYFWAIEEESKLEGHIGNISAYIDLNNSVADVAILIGEAGAAGQGYASEAWQAVCRFLLTDVQIRKIAAGTLASNLAMIRVAEKAEMKADGIRRRHYLCESKEEDIIYFALFRDVLPRPLSCDSM